MIVLVTAKNEDNLIKNEGPRVLTTQKKNQFFQKFKGSSLRSL